MSDHAETIRVGHEALDRLNSGARQDLGRSPNAEWELKRLAEVRAALDALVARCEDLGRDFEIVAEDRQRLRAERAALENALREIGKFAASHDRTDHHENLLRALRRIAEEAEAVLAAGERQET